MKLKLTKEQSLTLENRKLKNIIADLLHTLQDIAITNPQVSKAKEAIAKAIADYTGTRE